MSWAEHMAAETAPTSKYGVKRWTEAFKGVEDQDFRNEVAQIAVSLDSPEILNRYVKIKGEFDLVTQDTWR